MLNHHELPPIGPNQFPDITANNPTSNPVVATWQAAGLPRTRPAFAADIPGEARTASATSGKADQEGGDEAVSGVPDLSAPDVSYVVARGFVGMALGGATESGDHQPGSAGSKPSTGEAL